MKVHQHARRMLDTTTAHVPQATVQALAQADLRRRGTLFESLVFGSLLDTGWIFHVCEVAGTAARACGHGELGAVLDLAYQHGFDWLRLDADGTALDGLPVFDW